MRERRSSRGFDETTFIGDGACNVVKECLPCLSAFTKLPRILDRHLATFRPIAHIKIGSLEDLIRLDNSRRMSNVGTPVRGHDVSTGHAGFPNLDRRFRLVELVLAKRYKNPLRIDQTQNPWIILSLCPRNVRRLIGHPDWPMPEENPFPIVLGFFVQVFDQHDVFTMRIGAGHENPTSVTLRNTQMIVQVDHIGAYQSLLLTMDHLG